MYTLPTMSYHCGDHTPQNECDFKQIWEAFNRLRIDKQLCDAVLVVEDRRFPVHRAILAANSPYFRALFTNGMKESEQQEIHIPGLDAKTMNDIIDYVYTRSVRITMDNVTTLLPQSDSFLIPGLVEKCCHFLSSALTPMNCIGIWKFAQNMYRWDLANVTRKYILDNFMQVAMKSIEFLNMEPEELLTFFADDELNVHAEEDTFQAIVRWVDYKASSRTQFMSQFLRRIRLGLVQSDYFVDKICSHPYVSNNPKCQDIIQEAWGFLYSIERLGNRNVDLRSPLVRPRVPRDVLFTIGGWSGGNPISFMETYDSRADRWYTHPGLEDSTPRAYHGLVTLDGLIYMLGGFDGTQYYNNVRCYDPVSKAWKDVAPMYSQRCYVSSAVANGNIYVCGGYDGRWRLSSAERYDPTTNQWSQIANMFQRRSDAGADSIHGKVYIVGGFDGEHCLNTSEMYDSETNQWTMVEPLSCPRSGVAVVANHDFLYVIGGFNGERRLDTGERYCPISRRWTSIPEMYTPRSNCAVAVLDEMIFIIGGFNGSFTITQVECYDAESDQWFDATDMNINRSALKACVISSLSNIKDYTFYGQIGSDGDGASPSQTTTHT